MIGHVANELRHHKSREDSMGTTSVVDPHYHQYYLPWRGFGFGKFWPAVSGSVIFKADMDPVPISNDINIFKVKVI